MHKSYVSSFVLLSCTESDSGRKLTKERCSTRQNGRGIVELWTSVFMWRDVRIKTQGNACANKRC
jgi:hypothetical protein